MGKEYLMIIAMGSGCVLGGLGGSGFKWMRRFVLPVILGVVCVAAGREWTKSLYMTLCMVAAFSMPYGERTPYWLKFIVGCGFIAPTLFFGFSIWQIVTPVLFIGMFKLSNMVRWAKDFTWKIVECLTFTLVGAAVAVMLIF